MLDSGRSCAFGRRGPDNGEQTIPTMNKGRYLARWAQSQRDIQRAQELRWMAFHSRPGSQTGEMRDHDSFDAICRHLLVEVQETQGLVACCRVLPLSGGTTIGQSYAAQFYDVSPMADYASAMAEIGRFCLHPNAHDPDILRIAWALLTRFVDQEKIGMLFGCTSFAGTDGNAYLDAFGVLDARHLGPENMRPRERAPHVFRFRDHVRDRLPDTGRAAETIPPLLRTYMLMGGWVSDHAVVDDDLGTLHVFTGLEISAIPAGRARALRQIAGQA